MKGVTIGERESDDGGIRQPVARGAGGRRTRGRSAGGGADGDRLLLAHGGDDGDEELLAVVEVGLDLLAEFALGDLDVVLGGAVAGHEVEEAVVDVDLAR